MFNAKKKSYSREVLTVSTNQYKEKIENYSFTDNILMFISLTSNEVTGVNDMRVKQCSHIGLTSNEVEVGDRIGGKYTIEFINTEGREKICFLKEIENNGWFR